MLDPILESSSSISIASPGKSGGGGGGGGGAGESFKLLVLAGDWLPLSLESFFRASVMNAPSLSFKSEIPSSFLLIISCFRCSSLFSSAFPSAKGNVTSPLTEEMLTNGTTVCFRTLALLLSASGLTGSKQGPFESLQLSAAFDPWWLAGKVERLGTDELSTDFTGEAASNDGGVELSTEPDDGETGDCEAEAGGLGPSVDRRWRDLLRYSRRETFFFPGVPDGESLLLCVMVITDG